MRRFYRKRGIKSDIFWVTELCDQAVSCEERSQRLYHHTKLECQGIRLRCLTRRDTACLGSSFHRNRLQQVSASVVAISLL